MYMISSNVGNWEACMVGVVGHIKNYNDFRRFIKQVLYADDHTRAELVIENLREITNDVEWDEIADKYELCLFDDAACHRVEVYVSECGSSGQIQDVFFLSHVKPFK